MSEIPGRVEALESVANVLQAMEVRFYIGGSVASSFHGASRSTMDVDLVADLKPNDVDQFVIELQDEYYLSKAAIKDAIANLSCFHLIHLLTSFKVDVFILKKREFDINSMTRAKPGKIEIDSHYEIPIARPRTRFLANWLGIAWETKYRNASGMTWSA